VVTVANNKNRGMLVIKNIVGTESKGYKQVVINQIYKPYPPKKIGDSTYQKDMVDKDYLLRTEWDGVLTTYKTFQLIDGELVDKTDLTNLLWDNLSHYYLNVFNWLKRRDDKSNMPKPINKGNTTIGWFGNN